jgi:hypothetical protein
VTLARFLRGSSPLQQVLLVTTAPRGVPDHVSKDGGGGPGLEAGGDLSPHGIQKHGEKRPLSCSEFAGNLPHGALHPEKRDEMGLMEESASHPQKFKEPHVSEQLIPQVAGPLEECPVHPDDAPVRKGREVTAGRVFGEIFDGLENGRFAGLPRRCRIHARKALMASTTSAGSER